MEEACKNFENPHHFHGQDFNSSIKLGKSCANL